MVTLNKQGSARLGGVLNTALPANIRWRRGIETCEERLFALDYGGQNGPLHGLSDMGER